MLTIYEKIIRLSLKRQSGCIFPMSAHRLRFTIHGDINDFIIIYFCLLGKNVPLFKFFVFLLFLTAVPVSLYFSYKLPSKQLEKTVCFSGLSCQHSNNRVFNLIKTRHFISTSSTYDRRREGAESVFPTPLVTSRRTSNGNES